MSTTLGVQRAKLMSVPEGVDQLIICTKEHFCLTLLTVNAMWPESTAYFQAWEQLVSAHMAYGMVHGKC